MTRFTVLTAPALVSAVFCVGCVTKQGIGLPSAGPSKAEIAEFNARNRLGAESIDPNVFPRKTSLVPESDEPKVVIIGHIMALTNFDQADLNKRYDTYLKQVKSRSAEPDFTREWYLATGSGETAVRFSGYTGVYSRWFKAEIPRDLIQQMSFASTLGSFMLNTSGDLVAAERSPKTGTWITRLLCSEKTSDYGKCSNQYVRGIYQSADGREIDDKLRLIVGGRTIDPQTYKVKVAVVVSPPATSAPSAAKADPPAGDVKTPSFPVPASPNFPTAPAAPKDIARQLQTLNELREKKLISETEFQLKRKEILDAL